MKTIIVIDSSPFREVHSFRVLECESYKIEEHEGYTELTVVGKNGTGHQYIHMTEVHEVVWRKDRTVCSLQKDLRS